MQWHEEYGFYLTGTVQSKSMGRTGTTISKRELCPSSAKFTVNPRGDAAVWFGFSENAVSFSNLL